jgi:hypothetical protein
MLPHKLSIAKSYFSLFVLTIIIIINIYFQLFLLFLKILAIKASVKILLGIQIECLFQTKYQGPTLL